MTIINKLDSWLSIFPAVGHRKWALFMWCVTAVLLMMYLAPYVVSGHNGHWMIWDNLDSNYVAYKVLLESGLLFAPNSTIIDQPLGGVLRGTLPSELDAFVWLYAALGPEGAYIANRHIMSIAGFIGMYLLLSRHVLLQKEDAPVAIGVALCFAVLPFWPFGGLSVAGQPLVLYALLNIRQGDLNWPNWLIIILYPFYSSLILSGFFFLVMISCIWVYDVGRRRTSLALLFAIAALAFFYVVSHYRLFLDFMLPTEYVSHRVEFASFGDSSLKESIRNAAGLFTEGQAHAPSLQSFIILPLLGIVSIYVLFLAELRLRKLFTIIGVILVAISIFYGFKAYPLVSVVMDPIKALIPMQFDRFYFLGPMLWMVIFAVALKALTAVSPPMRLVLIAVIGLQVLYSFTKHEFIVNRGSPTVSQFFAEQQMVDVRDFIGMPVNSYRVATLGIHPSVTLFNGFHTLDGYWANYPLEYKHRFREIIAGELEKEYGLMQYYDNWGSRVYMFNTATGKNMVVSAGNDIVVENLNFDWDAFYELGGRFLLSAVQINSATSSQLEFVKKFVDAQSAWDIYLYEVNPSL